MFAFQTIQNLEKREEQPNFIMEKNVTSGKVESGTYFSLNTKTDERATNHQNLYKCHTVPKNKTCFYIK